MSKNKDLIPIGTLYVTVDKRAIYILRHLSYSKYNPEREEGYYFTRVTADAGSYSREWYAYIGIQKDLKGVFYYPKRNRC